MKLSEAITKTGELDIPTTKDSVGILTSAYRIATGHKVPQGMKVFEAVREAFGLSPDDVIVDYYLYPDKTEVLKFMSKTLDIYSWKKDRLADYLKEHGF